jgi:hypothetical protein
MGLATLFEQTQPGETDVAKSFLGFGVDAEGGQPGTELLVWLP